jgi:heat shock protein HtpX
MTDPDLPLVHSFTVDTELSHSQLLAFPKFVREQLAFGQLPGIKMGVMEALVGPHGHYVEFASGPQRGTYECLVRMHLERPIKVEVLSSMGRDEAFEKQLENVLLMVVQFFEEDARRSTLYMAFVPGSPRTAQVRTRPSVMKAIFTGNMLSLFMISILIGVVIFTIMDAYGLRDYAPIVMIALMLSLVLSAGRLSAWRSPWRITKESREVVLVQHQVPEGMLEHYVGEYRDRIKMAKERAYELYSSCPGTVCAENIADVFSKSGLPADKNDFLVRRIDVYGLVEKVSSKFGVDVPAIVISQDPRPNAAATGFTRQLGTMIITMGLLVQLEEEEIEVVIGHELSHLRSGDPIVLFSLVMAEYLARVYLYWQYIAAFWLPYLLLVFWAIFFFGKFLESRADLESALILGKPKVMAESLKKIGFRRLVLAERFLEPGGSRLGEWLRMDPHPPLYFRIERLEGLDLKNPPRHPLLSSIRAVTSGFVNSRKAL